MENQIQQKESILKNIQETKNKMNELQEYLAQQFVQFEKEQEMKKLRKLRHEQAKKNHSQRFSSFANYLERPQYSVIFKESKLFNNDSTFINQDQPHLSSIEQSLLISPDRNKNSEHYSYKLEKPVNKQKSEFPPIRRRILSQKEIKRLEFWEANYQNLQEAETSERNKMLVGKIKKELIQQRRIRAFKPTDQCLRYFDKNISLISENPITQRQLQKDVSLPKIKEKKVWMPNNNYF